MRTKITFAKSARTRNSVKNVKRLFSFLPKMLDFEKKIVRASWLCGELCKKVFFLEIGWVVQKIRYFVTFCIILMTLDRPTNAHKSIKSWEAAAKRGGHSIFYCSEERGGGIGAQGWCMAQRRSIAQSRVSHTYGSYLQFTVGFDPHPNSESWRGSRVRMIYNLTYLTDRRRSENVLVIT